MLLIESVIESQRDRALVDNVICLKLDRVEEIWPGAQRYRGGSAKRGNQCGRCRIASDGASAQWRRADSRSLAGNCFDRVNAAAEPVAFIREEEKCFVLLDWTTDRSTKLIHSQLGLFADDVVEKVCGVKRVVPKIFEAGAVKLIAT